MRPLRLELEGFTAFRERLSVDFAGADLFALVGATGAGKSSLIDAMCLALYGSVPRLDRRMVEPIVSAGALEARVRFDFTVGREAYTAARVVRRQARGGASTKEARLETGERVLAGDADGVTKAVEELLGLGFEQFTRCVVLPQGEFARFLHDKPRERQDLLVRLLELDVYERMRGAASQRATAADSRAEVLAGQRERLAEATPQAVEAAGERVAALERLRADVAEAAPVLATLAATAGEAEQAAEQAMAQAEQVARVAVPDGVADLGVRLEQLEADLVRAEAACDQAETQLVVAQEAREQLPTAGELERLRGLHARRAELAARIARGEPALDETAVAEAEASRREADARRRLAHAEADLNRLRDAHAAHALAVGLSPGAACPVCGQAVAHPPTLPTPPGLDATTGAVAHARQQVEQAAAALRAAGEQRAGYAQRLEQLREQLATVDADLDGHPDADTLQRLGAEAAAADAAVRAAQQVQREATARRRDRTGKVQAVRRERDGAWAVFDATRDGVAGLGAPATDRSDLAGAWRALSEWATAEAPRRASEAQAHAERARRVEAERRARHEALVAACAGAGVALADDRSLHEAVTEALLSAQAEQRRLADALAEVDRLRGEERRHREDATVARSLAQHLAANRFERWLLDEALQRLAAGASGVLRDLSAGAYSLAVDAQRNFAVIDHRNADERRPARTLSGGETFLASLALALTLAEHLAEMATTSAPRLESIFLDEGFGTLDPETLDTVAAAVEELGSTGRTVGVVTHVRDLAERIPVRFEVRKGPVTSTVARVEI